MGDIGAVLAHLPVTQRLVHVMHVRRGSVSGFVRISGKDGVANEPMVLEQQFALSGPAIQLRPIEDHVVAEEFEKAAHHMQEDYVVRGLGDGDVEFGIPLRLQARVAAFVCVLDRVKALGKHFVVIGRAAKRGIIRADAIERFAELDEIQGGFRMAEEDIGQRSGDTVGDGIANEGTASMAGLDQTGGLQLLQGLAQRWPRDVQLLRQLPFGRQAFSRLQQSLENHFLEFPGDRTGQPFLLYLGILHVISLNQTRIAPSSLRFGKNNG